MTVQLGHEEECPAPEPIKKPFLIFDMNGIHKLQLAYCGCSKTSRIERFQQLLRERWYPATFDRPRTAFTFDVLDTYHKLTLQGKLTLYDFYHGILHKTDNCGKSNPIVSLRIFILNTTDFLHSTGITSLHAVFASGDTSN